MVRVTYALNLLWSPTGIWEQFGKVQTAWADYTCSAPLDRSWHISRHTGHVWCMWCTWCVRHMCGVCGVCCTNHAAVVATISFSPSLPTCAGLSIYQCVCKSVSQTWVVINFDHAVRLGQVCVTRLGVYRSGKLCGEQGRRGRQYCEACVGTRWLARHLPGGWAVVCRWQCRCTVESDFVYFSASC